MERRDSTRIPFRAPAFLMHRGKRVTSQTVDISRHGIFVNTPAPHKEGDRTLISIFLRDGNKTMSVTLPCDVTRVCQSGIGCTSPYLDPETLLFMSNLIHSRKVHSREFIDAFYNYMEDIEGSSDS